jgi:hypothetical protein
MEFIWKMGYIPSPTIKNIDNVGIDETNKSIGIKHRETPWTLCLHGKFIICIQQIRPF